jgi:hypothetical protein
MMLAPALRSGAGARRRIEGVCQLLALLTAATLAFDYAMPTCRAALMGWVAAALFLGKSLPPLLGGSNLSRWYRPMTRGGIHLETLG